MRIAKILLIVASVGLLARSAQATNLSETVGVDGFSSDYQAPTLLSLTLGSNLVVGEVGAPGSGTILADGSDDGSDGDYFTVVVPNGMILDDIIVNRYNVFNRGFAAYAPGATFSKPNPNSFYVFSDGALFSGPNDILGGSPQPLFGGSGLPFDPSDGQFNVDQLGAGTYSFLIQENGGLTAGYILDFRTVAVPEPSTLAALALGAVALPAFRRKRRAS